KTLFEQIKSSKLIKSILSKKNNSVLKENETKKTNSFLLNFFSLNFSSLAGKFLNFILFLFLIRYLAVNEYGIYTLVWAQISLLSPLVDFGTTSYGIVHLSPEKEDKFVKLFNLRIFLSVIVFVLTLFFAFFLFKSNLKIFGLIALTSFTIFTNLFSGTYLIRNAITGKIYNSSIVSTFFNLFLVIALILGLITFRSINLVFIEIFIIYNLNSLVNFFLVTKDLVRFKFKLDFTSWFKLIKKAYIFVLISFFAGLYFKLDVFILQIFKGEKEVGVYSAGYKFFEALITIAGSYNIASTPIFAKLVNNNMKLFLHKIKKDFLFLLFIGSSVVLVTELLGPLFLPYFMKGNYESSIQVLRVVIIGLPIILLSSIFLNALYVLRKAYLVIYIFAIQTIVNFILNLILIPKYSYMASSYITVFSEMTNFILILIVFIHEYKKKYENIS
ncbi:MAG: oligosaccharide flippase family protein, partial [Cyanobacteria bacterium]|nr:oligosaccharide flippase family protein [Cyanobacteriota bacterium]